MGRSKVNKRCFLCYTLDKNDGDTLIWYDSMQLCEKCYNKFKESAYNQRIGLINSVKCYRKLIERYENSSNVRLETNFNIWGD